MTLQISDALKEIVARGLMPPPDDPGGYNALAEKVSHNLLQSPFGGEVRYLLAAYALTPRPAPRPNSPQGAEALAALIHSLALDYLKRTGDLPSP